MKLFLDSEWNGFGGELLSIALVPETSLKKDYLNVFKKDSFYVELVPPKEIEPWVQEHVMTKMTNKEKLSYQEAQRHLRLYLTQFDSVHILADWPEDIEILCKMFITGPGQRISLPEKLTFEFCQGAPNSVVHNALQDAIDFGNWYFRKDNV